jgi:hypothetical protein
MHLPLGRFDDYQISPLRPCFDNCQYLSMSNQSITLPVLDQSCRDEIEHRVRGLLAELDVTVPA